MDIRTECRVYHNAETYDVEKLNELIHQLNNELITYERYAKHYTPTQYRDIAVPHISAIHAEKQKVLVLLEHKLEH